MIIRLENIAQYVGQTVTIQGWLYDKTDKGKLQFLQVRDGTGIAQAVVFKKDVSPEDVRSGEAPDAGIEPHRHRHRSAPTSARPASPAASRSA